MKIIAAGLAVVANDTKRLLLLQRSFYNEEDPNKGKWEFPGGRLEVGEEPLEAAMREWQEEVGQLLPKGEVKAEWTSPSGTYMGFVYVISTEALVPVGTDSNRHVLNPDDPDEDHIEVVAWWDLRDIPAMPALRDEVKSTDWHVFNDVVFEGDVMPYTTDTAPHWVQQLPSAAKSAWIKAFNSAYKQHGNDVAATRIATGSIKKMGYKKSAGGEWAMQEERIDPPVPLTTSTDGSPITDVPARADLAEPGADDLSKQDSHGNTGTDIAVGDEGPEKEPYDIPSAEPTIPPAGSTDDELVKQTKAALANNPIPENGGVENLAKGLEQTKDSNVAEGEDVDETAVAEEAMYEKKWDTQARRKAASKGFANEDGSYPIDDKSDLKNAIRAFGRGGAKDSDKRHIIKRAITLGATDMLPSDWPSSRRVEEAKIDDDVTGTKDGAVASNTDMNAVKSENDEGPGKYFNRLLVKREDVSEEGADTNLPPKNELKGFTDIDGSALEISGAQPLPKAPDDQPGADYMANPGGSQKGVRETQDTDPHPNVSAESQTAPDGDSLAVQKEETSTSDMPDLTREGTMSDTGDEPGGATLKRDGVDTAGSAPGGGAETSEQAVPDGDDDLDDKYSMDHIVDSVRVSIMDYTMSMQQSSGIVGIFDSYFILSKSGKYFHYTYAFNDDGEVEIDWDSEKEMKLTFASESAPASQAAAFAESVDLSEARVDGDTIKDVVLLSPGWSANNRFYSADIVAQSAPLWEGIRAYGNHDLKTPNRSIFEQFGYYKGAHVDSRGRLRADLHLVGEDAKKQHIKDWAMASISEGKPFMGLSIVAVGDTELGESEGRRGQIVKEIISPRSVDVVTDPAAGGGFDLIAAGMEPFDDLTNALLEHMPFEQWRDSNPEYLKRLRKELISVRQDAEVKGLTVQVTSLSEDKQDLNEQLLAKDLEVADLMNKVRGLEAKEKAATLLVESRLPSVLYEDIKPVLIEAILAEEDTGEILEREVLKASKLRTSPIAKYNGQGPISEDRENLTEDFVRRGFAFGGEMPGATETATEYKERIMKERDSDGSR